jgi:hypothetical protein
VGHSQAKSHDKGLKPDAEIGESPGSPIFFKMEIPIGKHKGEYPADLSWMSDEWDDFRAMYTVQALLNSFPEASRPDNQDPDMKYFLPQRFVDALQIVGWEFHGTRYLGRHPMSKWRTRGFAKDVEVIPELEDFSLTGADDLVRIVANAQKRWQGFEPEASYGSPRHGDYVSQELYEAGWFFMPGKPANVVVSLSELLNSLPVKK